MKPRENFGGRAAVIMALAGSAIGLGNIWRFPYMVGENGGAAFILVYILASLLLLLPIFLAEAVIGRRSRSNAFGAMKALAPHSRWKWTGLFAVLTPMIVLSYYSVVGGWALGYFGTSLTGGFLQSDPEALHGVFASFLGLHPRAVSDDRDHGGVLPVAPGCGRRGPLPDPTGFF